MRKLAFVLVISTLIFGGGMAQVPPGYDAASFARVGMGARAQAMGGAFTAIAQGPIAGYWNPAGLIGLADFQAEGMYTDWLGAGIDLQYISLAGYPPLGEERPTLELEGRPLVFGLSWLSVHVADIPWWEEEGGYGTFDAWSHLMIASVSWQLEQSPSISIGFNVKLYHDQILEGKSLGIGYDVGFLWRQRLFEVPVSFAFVTTDVGNTEVQWYGTTGEPVNYVPWLARVGAAAELWDGMALVAVSYEWGVDRPRFERLRLGAELSLEWLALRAGYDWLIADPSGRWTMGVGISPWDWLSLDYAFLPGKLGDTHLLALKVAF